MAGFKIHTFDSAKAIIFLIKRISLFMECLNQGHYVYDIHPPTQNRSAAMRQREERAKAFLGYMLDSQLFFLL